jgi:hypothetical protein
MLAFCGLLEKGHHIYMDNYYTSPELFDLLELNGTYACGTVRTNRQEVPKALKATKCTEGQAIFRRRGHLLALKFHDKRDVHMLTTIHEATMLVIQNRRGQVVRKPTAIANYVQKMGGVDLSDQIQQYYGVFRKTHKYWRKLFFYLLNLLVTNSYVLHRKYGTNGKLCQYDFQMSIVRKLLTEAENAPIPNKRGRSSQSDPPRRIRERHFPSFIPPPAGSKRKHGSRNCHACSQPNKRKESSFHCSECDVTLCVPDCFQAYHTVQNYKAVVHQQ